MKKQHQSERGQVLILLVVGLVAMMGFTALAIDGGMVYSDRRYDQSASDAAALAGAGVTAQEMDNGHIYYTNIDCGSMLDAVRDAGLAAGKSRADSNLFTLDEDLSDNHGIQFECPSVWPDTGAYLDKYVDIHTMVTSETKTAFAYLIFGGQLKNTVNSVVRVRPRHTEAFGYAIVSTKDSCQGGEGGVTFDGCTGTIVNGGGIFSAACITQSGGGNIDIENSDAGIRYTTDWDQNGGGSVSPAPTRATTPLPEMNFTVPDCNDPDLPNYGDVNNGGDLQPGRYGQIKTTGNETVTFAAGLYCIEDGMYLSGASAHTVPDSTGQQGVTFYFLGGGFNTNANVTVNLDAPMDEPQPVSGLPVPVRGLLVYLAKGNHSQVDLQGGSCSSFLGTIYAPDGQIDVGGNSGVNPTFNTQLIGETVKLHGNVQLDINFNTSENVSHSPGIEMLR